MAVAVVAAVLDGGSTLGKFFNFQSFQLAAMTTPRSPVFLLEQEICFGNRLADLES